MMILVRGRPSRSLFIYSKYRPSSLHVILALGQYILVIVTPTVLSPFVPTFRLHQHSYPYNTRSYALFGWWCADRLGKRGLDTYTDPALYDLLFTLFGTVSRTTSLAVLIILQRVYSQGLTIKESILFHQRISSFSYKTALWITLHYQQ